MPTTSSNYHVSLIYKWNEGIEYSSRTSIAVVISHIESIESSLSPSNYISEHAPGLMCWRLHIIHYIHSFLHIGILVMAASQLPKTIDHAGNLE